LTSFGENRNRGYRLSTPRGRESKESFPPRADGAPRKSAQNSGVDQIIALGSSPVQSPMHRHFRLAQNLNLHPLNPLRLRIQHRIPNLIMLIHDALFRNAGEARRQESAQGFVAGFLWQI
jgi:hypothetical protein